jgi:hypothetical protein
LFVTGGSGGSGGSGTGSGCPDGSCSGPGECCADPDTNECGTLLFFICI